MTKADLKTGMACWTKEEKQYIVMLSTEDGDILIHMESEEQCELVEWNEDLTNKINTLYDIVEIYAPPSSRELLEEPYNTIEFSMVWRKKEPIIEVTMDDVEKKFGHKVKIINKI